MSSEGLCDRCDLGDMRWAAGDNKVSEAVAAARAHPPEEVGPPSYQDMSPDAWAAPSSSSAPAFPSSHHSEPPIHKAPFGDTKTPVVLLPPRDVQTPQPPPPFPVPEPRQPTHAIARPPFLDQPPSIPIRPVSEPVPIDLAPPQRPPLVSTGSETSPVVPHPTPTPTTNLGPPSPDSNSSRPISRVFGGFLSSSSKTVTKKRAAAVRMSTAGIIAELVQEPYKDASIGVVDACKRGCEEVGLSLSELLQEATIENHTPLYWAIMKATGSSAYGVMDGPRSLVAELLAHAAPLTQPAASDVLLACTTSSDNTLYQICQPYLFAVDNADRMILGEREDYAPYALEIAPTHDGFTARLAFPLFHRRMRSVGRVGCEFVFCGRIFDLSFEIIGHEHALQLEKQRRKDDTKRRTGPAIRPLRKRSSPKTGQWIAALGLLEHSASTPLDARVLISPNPSSATPSLGQPQIQLPLQTLRDRVLSPTAKGREIDEVWSRFNDKDNSTAPFKSEIGPYVAADGTLHLTLEARLAKPKEEQGCIIC